MIYLSGVTNDVDEPNMVRAGIGLIAQPGNSYHLRVWRYPWWAADNGCFAAKWEEDGWLRWLDRLPRQRCLFVVAPDVYPDAAATLYRSMPFLPLIRQMGFPAAVVAQDGAERLDLPWDEFDCLFIGGERTANPRDEWKLSAAVERLVHTARGHGCWVHMGRVNSLRRIQRARQMGCHSADGTFVKYRRRKRVRDGLDDHARRGAIEVGQWLTWLDANPTLPDGLEGPSLPVHRESVRDVRLDGRYL